MAGALAGIRIVDLTSVVLGPVATQILGDMGAEVIKIEPPEGDPVRGLGPARHPGMGAYFLNINRNKKSLVLDLKRPQALAALLRLAGGADVFVHNMRPGAAARLGIDYAAIAAASPRIVYAWASGYRADGPHRDRAAFDDVIQGESGMAAINAGADGAPRYLPMAVSDKICGHALASAIGMALFARERSGRGQEVHVPMLETMVAFNLVDHLWHGVLAEPEKGLGYPRMFTPYRRPYATEDGMSASWRRPTGSGATSSPRSSAPTSPTTRASRRSPAAPPISTNSIPSSPSACASAPPRHGGRGSTPSTCRTAGSTIWLASSPTPICATPAFSARSSTRPRGRP